MATFVLVLWLCGVVAAVASPEKAHRVATAAKPRGNATATTKKNATTMTATTTTTSSSSSSLPPPPPPSPSPTKKFTTARKPAPTPLPTLEQMLRRQWEIVRDYVLKESAASPREEVAEPKLQSDSPPTAVKEEDAVRIYTRACERFGTRPNGAVLAAARYGSKVVKPSHLRGGDADVLALVEALTHPGFPPVAALDLADADGSSLTRTAASLALSHVIAERDSLKFLAVAPGTPLGAQGVERLLLAGAPFLTVLRVADCDIGDRGADAVTRFLLDQVARDQADARHKKKAAATTTPDKDDDDAVTPSPPPQKKRLDVSRNHIGPRALRRLQSAGRRADVALKLRGNARWLERSCGSIQAVGAAAAPIAGAFLVWEARRLDLDRGAVAACALYALTSTAFFACTALPHLLEEDDDDDDFVLDAAARCATFLAVAGAHAPFLAFVDLGLPRNFGVGLWTACAGAALANVLFAQRTFSKNAPPTLRKTSLTADKVPVVLLAAFVPFLRFPALRAALSPAQFRALAGALGLALVATALDLTVLCKPAAYLLHLVAASLHYLCVLTALVWHFLPTHASSSSSSSSSSHAAGGATINPPRPPAAAPLL